MTKLIVAFRNFVNTPKNQLKKFWTANMFDVSFGNRQRLKHAQCLFRVVVHKENMIGKVPSTFFQ
jgi:hypothetical protein